MLMRNIKRPSLLSGCLTLPSCSIPKGPGSHPRVFPPLLTAPSSMPHASPDSTTSAIAERVLTFTEERARLVSCCCLKQKGSFLSGSQTHPASFRWTGCPSICVRLLFCPEETSSFENHTTIKQLTSHRAGILPAPPLPTLQEKPPDEVAPACAKSLFNYLGPCSLQGDPSPCLCKSPNLMKLKITGEYLHNTGMRKAFLSTPSKADTI